MNERSDWEQWRNARDADDWRRSRDSRRQDHQHRQAHHEGDQQGGWNEDYRENWNRQRRGSDYGATQDWGAGSTYQPQQREWQARERPERERWDADRPWGGSSAGRQDYERGRERRWSGEREAMRRDGRDGGFYGASGHGWSGPDSDFAGRDGAGASEPGYGRGYGPDYGRAEGRGFLDRAGDEIASWFGDEDAARRREQDYRGHGPADYTRSDERIREDANDRLTDDPRLDARRISVSVSDGEVTLNGTVGTREAKRRAEDMVDRVSGVRHVQNNLRIEQRERHHAADAPWTQNDPSALPTWASGTATTGAGRMTPSASATGTAKEPAKGASSAGTAISKTPDERTTPGQSGSGSDTGKG